MDKVRKAVGSNEHRYPMTVDDHRAIRAALKGNPGFSPIHQQHWYAGFCSDMAQRGLRVDGQGFVIPPETKTAVA